MGIEAVHVPHLPRKNSSDLYMTCDMMDLMDHLDTYVIVSNDSDFRHVMVCLRKRGKRTVAVTVNGGSRHLVRWGDDHYDLTTSRSPKRLNASDMTFDEGWQEASEPPF